MEWQTLIVDYGYVAVLVWAVMEGESVLLAAGFLAHQGFLDPVLVALLAALGGFAGDQCFFHFGRRYGTRLLARNPGLQARAGRVLDIARRHQDLLIVFCRFLYGLRVATPMTLGAAGVSPMRFALLNALGALLWGATITAVGWFAGQAAEGWLGELGDRAWMIAGALIALAAAAWLLRALLGRMRPGR